MDMQWIGTVASLLGVGMQAYDFIDRNWNSKHGTDPLKLLCIMHAPTEAWKKIHLEYTQLSKSMQKIYNDTHNKNGTLIQVVDPSILQRTFQESSLYDAVRNFEPRLAVSMENITLSFQGANIDRKINSVDNEKVKLALKNIYNSKSNVETIHKKICTLFRNVSSFIDEPEWTDNNVSIITRARSLYKLECNTVIDYTDAIIMGMLDIYEVAINAMS